MSISFVFPGQGSQLPGMGAGFRDDPAWHLVDEASAVVGRDVAHLLLDADADELVETRNAQLGTFVQSMVVLEALRGRGIDATSVAGHSLGEFSALCAAGVLSFADAARLVAERGEAMQVCCTERTGTMAAVLGLDDAGVELACEQVDGDVWVANLNAPGQVVVAGDPAAIDAVSLVAKEAGAKRVMPLDVSGAFHTPFMAPAADRLRAAIDAATFAEARVPVVANVDGAAHTAADDWPDLLERQLTSPVRWTDSVLAMVAGGTTVAVEVGPGSVLAGTIKRIEKSVDRHSVMTSADLDAVVDALGSAESSG